LRSRFQSLVLVLLLIGLSPAVEEKRLAIYSPQTNFTVAVFDHAGQEYVSVTDLVDPFGNVVLTHSGSHWKLRLSRGKGGELEAEFTDGDSGAKVRGKKIQLGHAFWADGQRGYVPLTSVTTLMTQLLQQPSTLRENSRRLFVGDVSTSYSAEMAKANPNRLVLHFTAPVNPAISTEPGRVRLTFNRDPLIAGGANPQNFDSPTIRSASFSEANGSAEITIATTTSAQATFSEGRKTITIAAQQPPSAPVQAQAPAATAPSTPTAQPNPPATSATNVPVPPTQIPTPAAPRFLVIIDPSHGGDDPGATLANGLFEKDVTLAFARRIRADLEQRGIAAVLLRDGDASMSLDQRAVTANVSRGALYVCVHATGFGTGVRLYSARFNGMAKPAPNSFLPWDTAQAAYVDYSHSLVASVVTQLDSRQIHSIPLESGLRPLRNIAKPAIAVEVAAPENSDAGLTSVAYQQSIASAISAAISNARSTLEAR
jgi:N-acetylmuramoyl-L-alanine amidase